MTRPDSDERTALIAQTAVPEPPRSGATQVFLVLGSCLAYICLSASLINYNKFLMHEHYFPFSVALTSLHMMGSTFLCVVLYAIFGASWFPSVQAVKGEGTPFLKKLVPLSVFFALSICLSNEAYLYCSVPFLQMCKELNVVMVYFVGLLLMVEKFNVQTATILFIIMFGCCMSIHGEMRFSAVGFGFQITAQSAEVCKILLQQMIMQGSAKVDPLTMVMIMSPLCLVTLSCGLYFLPPSIGGWQPDIIVQAQKHWVHLALNCCNAFLLNVTVATVIKYASGVSFVLAGVIKDVCIVLAAAMLFGALVSSVQVIGFSIAVLGVAVHSIVRSQPELAKEHGITSTLGFALFGIHPAGKQALP
jgi:hypothetical protein